MSWHIDPVKSGDVLDCQSLFQSVFSAEISSKFWDWKYGLGRGRSLLARDDHGQVVAHYGATVRPIRLCGKPTRALQSCDVMVRARERGVFSRRGVFFQVARAFQERYLGDSAEFPLAYGFPHARAMRLPALLGLYREVDAVTEIHWPQLMTSGLLAARGEWLNEPQQILPLAERLWRRMAAQLEDFIVVDRDSDYLRYRYFNHPVFDYQYLVIRQPLSRGLLGLAVLKPDSGHVKIMDILADVREIPQVLLSIRRAISARGWQTLVGWVASSQRPYVMDEAGVTQAIDVSIPDHAWTPGLPIESIRNRWWVSFGDTDFA